MENFNKPIGIITIFTAWLILVGCSGVPGNNPNPENPPNSPEVTKTSEASQSINQPAPTPATRSNLLFVIDSSGSMKALIEGKSKMETAKEVFNSLVETLAPETQVGLMAYGHRDKNNCRDSQLLVPLSPLQTELFRQQVQSLQPLGQTPISYSLRQAARVLQGKTGTKSIILVSDGEETCKEDPCKVAAELKKAEIDLKVHVIGFGIDKAAAKKQLACIAQATGGSYQNARNTKDLQKTLEVVVQDPPTTSPNRNNGRLVTISLDSNGKPIPWCIEIFRAGTGERAHLECTHGNPIIELTPGTYNISYYKGNEFTNSGKNNIEIKAGQETRVELEQTGRLLVRVLDQSGKEIGNVYIKAHPTREDVGWVIFGPNIPQELLPGVYNLEFWGGAWLDRKGVEVKPGEETKIEINYGQ